MNIIQLLTPPIVPKSIRLLQNLYQKQEKEGLQLQEIVAGPLQGVRLFLPTDRGDAGRPWRPWYSRMIFGEYENELLTALQNCVRPDAVFYDIGAHTGFFSCAWAHMGGAMAYAFEPCKANALLIRKNALVNEFEGIRSFGLALSSDCGEGFLLVNESTLGDASRGFISGQGGNINGVTEHDYTDREKVTLATLDYIAQCKNLRPPTALKIDVEGAEVHVLRGAMEILSRYKPVLLIEVHNICNAVYVEELLSPLGYMPEILTPGAQWPQIAWRPRE